MKPTRADLVQVKKSIAEWKFIQLIPSFRRNSLVYLHHCSSISVDNNKILHSKQLLCPRHCVSTLKIVHI